MSQLSEKHTSSLLGFISTRRLLCARAVLGQTKPRAPSGAVLWGGFSFPGGRVFSVHCEVSSALNNAWHIVGVQKLVVERMNEFLSKTGRSPGGKCVPGTGHNICKNLSVRSSLTSLWPILGLLKTSSSLSLSAVSACLIALHLSPQARAPPCGGHRRTARERHPVGQRWPAPARGRGQGPRLGRGARSARKTCPCGAVCRSSACRGGGGGSRSAGSRHLAWLQGQPTPQSDLQTPATSIS